MVKNSLFVCDVLLLLISSCATGNNHQLSNADYIQPFKDNPRYWQYKGRQILLLGDSKNGNLFQSPDIEEQLDLLVEVGGNYIRNVISSRDEGDAQPFLELENGRYDLNHFKPEYCRRFFFLLGGGAIIDLFVSAVGFEDRHPLEGAVTGVELAVVLVELHLEYESTLSEV